MGIFNWLFKRKKKVENIESELSCQTQTEENSLGIQFNALQEGENVDESGEVFECKIKPFRTSDKALIKMLIG